MGETASSSSKRGENEDEMEGLKSSSSNKAVFEDEGSLILPGFRLRRHPLPLAAGPCKAGKAVGWP